MSAHRIMQRRTWKPNQILLTRMDPPQPSKKSTSAILDSKAFTTAVSCTCSEYWWCLNNVAKGLKRNELPYALDVIDFTLRPMLKTSIGMENRHFL